MDLHKLHDSLPSFDELPSSSNLPKGCTWGLWDQAGQKDELGTLNLLTPKVVRNAVQEVTLGISVSLNLPLSQPLVPVFKRKPLEHNIIDNSSFSPSQSFDDTVFLNTQASSQWDGLRHVVHEKTGRLYNDVTKEDITGINRTARLGIDGWHRRGGIVARGVLVDYVAYAQRNDITYNPTEWHEITVDDLERAASDQGVTFRQGDILIVRSGLVKWQLEHSNTVEAEMWAQDPKKACVGVSATEDTVSWIWNRHFAAVAGDALAWESVPYPVDRPSLHQHLIPMFGMPIGELWDLEELASTCARLGRYSFLLTSVPLRVPGGIASPPNAVAVF
ncbi:hypothetical protein BDV39DRAFT_201086 [Aspergillus sergii]|uniref:Cyclase-domain-containing protein n=1 Tax=Aspergillus sergii TaxID=1034303 RepID=A0A5N6XDV7_9EURO|nr:hypothetical protein BDV39DRAFT_201086 [Aspergillus sergii]